MTNDSREPEKAIIPTLSGYSEDSSPPETTLPHPGDFPAHIGRYQVERILGKGGFGLVYLAHDPQLDRKVAIKVPRLERVVMKERIQDLEAEARRAAGLAHPGIVGVYDVGQDVQTPFYMVTQYIDGKTLHELIASCPLDHGQTARIVAWVADALQYAHSRGFVHRDLKPSNILVDPKQRPHIADFGLALHEDEQRSYLGTVSGTPAYMSPEQVRGESHHLDGRSDVWSLGVVMYEMLARRRPFAGDTLDELFHEIVSREPKPLRQVDANIPKELERICLKALRKQVTDRYSTAMDMADDLWYAVHKHRGTAPTTEWERPVEARHREIAARLSLTRAGCALAVTLASLLVCVLSAGGYSHWRLREGFDAAVAEKEKLGKLVPQLQAEARERDRLEKLVTNLQTANQELVPQLHSAAREKDRLEKVVTSLQTANQELVEKQAVAPHPVLAKQGQHEEAASELLQMAVAARNKDALYDSHRLLNLITRNYANTRAADAARVLERDVDAAVKENEAAQSLEQAKLAHQARRFSEAQRLLARIKQDYPNTAASKEVAGLLPQVAASVRKQHEGVLMSAKAPPPPPSPAELEESNRDLDMAKTAQREGRVEDAHRLFARIMKNHPNTPAADEALNLNTKLNFEIMAAEEQKALLSALTQVEIAKNEGRYEDALRTLEEAVWDNANAPLAKTIRLTLQVVKGKDGEAKPKVGEYQAPSDALKKAVPP